MSNVDTGTVPILPLTKEYRHWLIGEIYTGPTGAGRYVPNLDDSALSWDQGLLRCIEVNESTHLSVFAPWEFPETGPSDQDDLLLGVGPGYQSESWRVFIDTSVTPHTLAIDGRLHTYAADAAYCKVFKGYTIEGSGVQVISAWYNQNNEYVSENIPLLLTATDDVTNVSIKAPAVGYSSEALSSGEPLTVVVYGANGRVISLAKMLSINSTFIRGGEAAQRYIRSIGITSPFISESEENTLVFPMNLPVEALTRIGWVMYSDGSQRPVPIDGNKMSLMGLEEYVATINGQRAPLVLTYKLSANESAEQVQGGNLRHLSEIYYARTTAVVGTYSVKLFVIPQWIDEIVGWRLDYILYNLDRGDFYYATPYVEPGVNSAAFEPKLYGTVQELAVAVDLNQLDSRLAAYRHVQTFSITLMGNGIEDRTPWFITHSPGQNPAYGGGLKAHLKFIAIGNWQLKIDCGIASLDAWLDQLYYRSQPLYNPSQETRPPAPTHFMVNLNGIRNEYPLSSWNTVLPSITGGSVGKSCIIEWIRKSSGLTLQMGCSPLVIVQEI